MARLTHVFTAALLLVSLMAPTFSAQGTSQDLTPTTAKVEDNPGDVMVTSSAPPQAAPSQFDHLDIIEISLGEETETTIKAAIKFKTMNPPVEQAPFLYGRSFGIYFKYGEEQYRVALANPNSRSQACVSEGGYLQYFDNGAGQFRVRKCAETEILSGEAKFVFTLPKEFIVNENRVPLRYGEMLTEFHAVSSTTIAWNPTCWFGCVVPVNSVTATDRAPDSGFGPFFQAALGTTGRGNIHLINTDPIRVSNGEGTTIVYKVLLLNQGSEDKTVLLTSDNPRPSDWQIRTPATLKVPAKGTVEFPVILAMSFTHDHGKTVTFKVRAENTRDANEWSTVELGVHWTEIPQPAGHHNKMYFHSADSEGNGDPFSTAFRTAYDLKSVWMNALESDPDATDAEIPAYFPEGMFQGFGQAPDVTGPKVAVWDFKLSPALLIGLDFMPEIQTPFITTLKGTVSAQDAYVTVTLTYCDPTGQGGGPGFGGGCGSGARAVVIGTGESSHTTMSAGAERNFEVPMTFKPESDLLAYKKDAALLLKVRLITDTPMNTGAPEPKVLMDPKRTLLEMPLLEYHDPIDQVFGAVGTLKMTAVDKTTKNVNPGRVTVFRFQMQNTGAEEQKLAAEIQGDNKAWAHVSEGEFMTLKPLEMRNWTVVVTAPEGAAEGERAELVFVAQSATDPNVVAITRLRASVVDKATEDIPDESKLIGVAQSVDTPGLPGMLIVLGVVGAALVASRRRRELL
jgi:hypothetical protein